MKYISVTAGLLIALMGMLSAQSHLHLRFHPELSSAQLYQPAFTGIQDTSIFDIGLDGFYGLEANTLSRENIFLSGQTLTDDIKTRIIDDLDSDNRVRLNAGGQVVVGFKIGKQPLSLSYGLRQQLFARVNNPNTVGLALFGNRRYEGQTLTDEGLNVVLASYQDIGIGTAFHWDKLHVGIRGKLLLGNGASLVDQLQYSLLTAPLGTQIDASGSYDIFFSQNEGLAGIGVAADLGLLYQVNEQLEIQASYLDLGFINWSGDILQNTFDISYEGEEIIDLDAFANVNELNGADSLINLILPDTTTGDRRKNLAGTYHIGIQYKIGTVNLLQLSLLGSPQSFGAGQPNPVVNLAYQRAIYRQIYLGVNAFVGGLDGFGFGGMASGNFVVGRNQIQAYIQATNVLGLLAPTSYGGNQVTVGLGYMLGK